MTESSDKEKEPRARKSQDICGEKGCLFQVSFEQAEVGLAHIGREGRWVRVNGKLCQILGYERDELLRKSLQDLAHPEDGDDDRTGPEERLLRKDGSTIWVSIRMVPVQVTADIPELFIAVIEDITERKLAEQQIQCNESRLRSIVRILHFRSETIQEFLNHALDEAISLTESRIGYIYFYDEERQQFILNAWSREVMHQCTITDPQTCYELKDTGIWGEAVRQRKPIILNDYQAHHPLKKGYPEGHAPLKSFLTLPVFKEDRIVAVVGVANKESAYDQTDVLQLTLLMDSVWRFVDIKRGEKALRESEERFRSIFEDASAGMIVIDPEDNLLNVNPCFCSYLDYAEADLVGGNYRNLVHPLDRPQIDRCYEDVREGHRKVCHYEARLLRKNGGERWFFISVTWLADEQDRPRYAVALLQDITELKSSQHALEKEREFLQTVIDGVADPIRVIDADRQVLLMNRSAQNLLSGNSGSGALPLQGESFADVDPPEILETIRRTGQNQTFVRKGIDGSGEEKIFELQASPFRDEKGRVLGIIETARDITEHLNVQNQLRENQKHLKYLAYHDPLTNLPNRLQLQEHLRKALSAARRAGKKVAFLLFDLDRFKNINDSLGHQAGDHVLREIGERLQRWIRNYDTVARLGGDEFGIILNQIDDENHVAAIVQKLLGVVSQPIRLKNGDFTLTASFGISVFPTDTENEESLLKFADAAMYRAKARGRNNFQFYTSDMNARTHEFLIMETALRKAVENQEFFLEFQPLVDLENRTVVCLEALLRWHHPVQGPLSPGDFIPLAEDTGLIVPIGDWVLSTACSQAVFWQSQGMPPIRISVNISGRQFREPDFAEKVERILLQSGLDPRWLELEITESVAMENVEKTILKLSDLKAKGVSLSVDDFGTGYSSLSYLKLFPIHKLKIDRSFVRDITSDPNDAAIASAVIALAHSMGLQVVGEGIETEEQLAFLKEKGCDFGQGYLFSRPLAAGKMSKEHFSAPID
ncbi:MAG: EAL domain-containing protein [Syntrophotaleaceae bacterium]